MIAESKIYTSNHAGTYHFFKSRLQVPYSCIGVGRRQLFCSNLGGRTSHQQNKCLHINNYASQRYNLPCFLPFFCTLHRSMQRFPPLSANPEAFTTCGNLTRLTRAPESLCRCSTLRPWTLRRIHRLSRRIWMMIRPHRQPRGTPLHAAIRRGSALMPSDRAMWCCAFLPTSRIVSTS